MGGNGKDNDEKPRSLDDEWSSMLKDKHDKFWANLERERARLETALQDNNSNNGPFSAFKHFIDSNINHLTDSFRQLPSNIRELRANMQRQQERMQQEELEISRRWTGSDDTPDHIDMQKQRSTDEERWDALDATIVLLEESQRRNAHVPNETIEALYRDDEPGERLDGLPNFCTGRSGQWLSVEWFKRNQYSPIRLEAHPDLAMYGPKWRAAFEDLMDATLDKPMGSFERVGMRSLYGKPQSTYYGPGLEWLLSLQCRGILPPLLPRIMNNETARNHLRGLGNSNLRGLANGSIIDMVRYAKEDLQWKPGMASAPEWMKSNLYNDVSDLVSEVATKATSDGEAEPLEYGLADVPADEMELAEHIMSYAYGRNSCNTSVPPLSLSSHEDQSSKDSSSRSHQDSESVSEASCPFPKELWDENMASEAQAQALLEFLDACMNEGLSYDGKMAELEGILEQARALDLDDAEDYASLIETLKGRQTARELQGTLLRQEEKAPSQKKPEVLSALTTTETTRLPDGTVTTKVVLKKRFADGREETSESVHTSKEDAGHFKQESTASEKEQPQKKGWFWS